MAGNPAASHHGPHVAKLVHRLKPIYITYITDLPPWDLGGPLSKEVAACAVCLCRLGPQRSTPSVLALIWENELL